MSQAGSVTNGGSPPSVSSLTIVEQIFTTNGTYTPTADLQYAIIEVVGAGAAGGGSDACETTGVPSTQISYGAGGAGGEYAKGVFSSGTIGASQAVTVGTGGVGTASSNGPSGSNTSVGALISAFGGSGGPYTPANLEDEIITFDGAEGGSGGSGGSVREEGESSLPVYYDLGSGTGYLPYFMYYLKGGDSFLGRGGITSNSISQSDILPLAGVNGASQGGGGSGAINIGPVAIATNPALAGGSGSNGIVIITEYILN